MRRDFDSVCEHKVRARQKINMKIQYASQLFKAAQKESFSKLLKPVAPTLVLAGNCVQPYSKEGRDFMRSASLAFDNVYVIPGPAEYGSNPQNCYQRNLTELYHVVYKHSNARILDNRAYDIDTKTHIAGTTLWHHLNGVATPVRDMIGVNKTYKMEDKRLILDMINKQALASMHLDGRDFLRSVVLNPENSCMNIVFGTYHVPVFDLLTAEDKADYNTAIMSNNELFYCEQPLQVWIAGAGIGANIVKGKNVLFVKNSYGADNYSESAVVELSA